MTADERAVSDAPLSPISFLLRSALVWRTQVAVRHGEQSTTYAELLARAERVAGGLAALGLAAGDRVATMLPNVPALIDLHFAAPGSGLVIVPMNTRLGPNECRDILRHSGARCLVAHPTLRATVEEALDGLEAQPHVVWDGEEYDRLAGSSAPRPLVAPIGERALLSINYTSGTTGQAKGVMYSHRGAYLHTLGVIAEAGLRPTSSYLWTLPMFHCSGWAFIWAVTAMGGRHVCLEAFDAARAWGLLREEGVTHLCTAPTVLTMLAESSAATPLVSPARVFVGGAPPSPALLERTGRLGLDITHLYGMTETYGPLAVCAWQPGWDGLPPTEQAELKARQGVGTVVTQPLRVVDDEMNDVPADGATLGELVMRGNNVMLGYYDDPDATADVFRGGWLHSGDLAVMHPDGYVEIRDRAKDIVISGGENISTVEVEQALAAHPDVVEAAVIGVPDERWGEVPVAFVVLRGGASPSQEELQEFVRGRIARYKVPRRIVPCDDLPKTATGKIQKFELRREHVGTG
jgi:fatty-acyl-CoA synthase